MVRTAEPLLGELGLALARHPELPVREHHRAHRSGDQEGGGDLEGDDVIGEHQLSEALHIATRHRIRFGQTDRGERSERAGQPEGEQDGEAQAVEEVLAEEEEAS